MQALTPEQTQFVNGVFHEAVDKALWGLVVLGGLRLRKLIRSIRPGIVADVTAAVNLHADARMEAHEEKDDQRFFELDKRLTEIHPLRPHARHTAMGD